MVNRPQKKGCVNTPTFSVSAPEFIFSPAYFAKFSCGSLELWESWYEVAVSQGVIVHHTPPERVFTPVSPKTRGGGGTRAHRTRNSGVGNISWRPFHKRAAARDLFSPPSCRKPAWNFVRVVCVIHLKPFVSNGQHRGQPVSVPVFQFYIER